MPNMPMMRSSPSRRNDSMPGNNTPTPPNSPTFAHTSSGVAAIVVSTAPAAIAASSCSWFPDLKSPVQYCRPDHPAGDRPPPGGSAPMETRMIGSLEVSVVGLGCNNFGMRIDRARSAAVVAAALDAGINFFDTADIYGGAKSEDYLGSALGPRRDEIVLATKFGIPYEGHEGGA